MTKYYSNPTALDPGGRAADVPSGPSLALLVFFYSNWEMKLLLVKTVTGNTAQMKLRL